MLDPEQRVEHWLPVGKIIRQPEERMATHIRRVTAVGNLLDLLVQFLKLAPVLRTPLRQTISSTTMYNCRSRARAEKTRSSFVKL